MRDRANPVPIAPGASAGYPRKRRQTRRRLLRAGMEVLAQRGPGHVSAAEVATVAEVATGTFYNHFPSADDLVDAIAHDLGRGVEVGRDTLAEIEHDPARRVAIGVLQLLDMAHHDPLAASAFVTLAAVRPAFRERVRAIVGQAIVDGVTAGRFDVDAGPAATNAVLGTSLQSMRSVVFGETDADSATDVAALVLRVLGVADAEAAEVVQHARAVIGA